MYYEQYQDFEMTRQQGKSECSLLMLQCQHRTHSCHHLECAFSSVLPCPTCASSASVLGDVHIIVLKQTWLVPQLLNKY